MSDKQQIGLKKIKEFYKDYPRHEVSEENGFLTIRILQNRYPNAAHIEKAVVEQDQHILEEFLKLYNLPFNTVEFHEYISYNLEVKEKV